MKARCQQMYENLMEEIDQRRTRVDTNSQWIEDCFHVIFRACTDLQALADKRKFADQQEEIWFYKEMKPQFAGQMEYFTLLYMAEVFAPEDHGQRIDYWHKEVRRSQDFFSKHDHFYQYYKQGKTESDTAWFVRSSSYADLAATLIAREKYLGYLQQRIENVRP